MTQLSAERFQDADRYTAYLRTIEGRLRTDLAWANLREFLLASGAHQRALDAGGGSGILALRLADLGFDVDLLDDSEPLLALARQEAEVNALGGRISFCHADVNRVSDVFKPRSFQVVVCHNLLEYMKNPLAALRGLAQLLRKNGDAIFSLLVRNRYGEVVKAALKTRDLEAARTALRAETILDTLYGRPVRVFDPGEVRAIAEQAGLDVVSQRGVRVVADYLDCEALTEDAYRGLLDFERLLGAQPQLATAARYTQIIACPCSKQSGETS